MRYPGTYIQCPGTYIRCSISISDVRYLYATSDMQYMTSDKGWARVKVGIGQGLGLRLGPGQGQGYPISEVYIGRRI